MDRTEHYKRIVKEIVGEYEQYPPSVGQMRMWSICDDVQGRYALFYAGWNQGKRTQGTPLFVRVSDARIHIEHDGLGHGILDRLVEEGVDRDVIDLEFSRLPVSEPVA